MSIPSPVFLIAGIARASAILVAGIGVAVLAGWAGGWSVLETVLPGADKMAASTAFCFVLAAAALWSGFESNRRSGVVWRWLCTGGGAFIALTGALKLIEHATGISLGVDAILVSSASHPVQMAPATAANFVVSGCALLLVRVRPAAGVFQFLVLSGGLMSWLALGNYFYGGEPLLPLAQMVAVTSATFFVLYTGILSTRSDTPLIRLLTSEGPGGTVGRRMIPAAMAIPTVLGWLRLEGQHAGWFGDEAGLALFALSTTVVFGALVWMNAAGLEESYAGRQKAEQRIHAQFERLSLLQQITRAIGERQDTHSIFQATIKQLEDHLPMDFCVVCVEDAGEVVVAASGLRARELAATMGLTEGAYAAIDRSDLFGDLARNLVYEPDTQGSDSRLSRTLAGTGLRSLVVAPLLVESQSFGTMLVARRGAGSFSQDECEFLRQLSEHVALAAHQMELHADLKKAYDDLRKSQEAMMQQERLRALGQMASGIAHDINNAISPVSLYTEVLLESEPDLGARPRKYMEIIQRAIEDVSHTIGRMREFYRQSSAGPEMKATDLNQMIRQVLDLTRARWSDMPQQRGIAIEVVQDLKAELPPISAVESEIREALINLIFNAVDAMPEGGVLTLRTFREKSGGADRVCAEVADSGAGMDEDTRRRCLEPFFTTKGERGTGLGLAMVHGIVRRHEAELGIESAAGRGTAIRMSFPVTAKAAAKEAGAEILPAPRRILLVDDDPAVIQSLSAVLANDGHTVVTAGGGQEGIDALQASVKVGEGFGTVITDLGMPRVDGRRVAAAVKASSPRTQVIMLTGWGQGMQASRDTPPHVDCVLSKPPRMRELRNALNQHRAEAVGEPSLPGVGV